MARKIQLRRDIAAAWTAANPVLSQGEIGLDLTNRKIKIGDGTTAWNTLTYWDDKETNLTGYATEEYVDEAVGAIDIPDVSNFITAEAIPFVPTDVADLTDTTNLLGSGTTVLSVEIESTAYKGFIARYGRVYDNGSSTELTVSKIVIFRESAYIGSGSTIDPTSSNDTFAVTGLGPSDVVAMFVLYGDTNGAKSLETLTEFVEVAVDTVLLDGGIEGQDNTIAEMRAAFYANINTLTAAAGGLVENFQFFDTPNTEFIINSSSTILGSGASFNVTGVENENNYTITVNAAGQDYKPGHKLLISGASLGGTDGGDVVITVVNVDENGGITEVGIYQVPNVWYAGIWTGIIGDYGILAASGFTPTSLNYNLENDTFSLGLFDSFGTGYVIGDQVVILGTDITYNGEPLASPENDLIVTITGVNLDTVPTTHTVAGTLPRPPGIWRENNISDGGNDQYDTANYINTNLASQISYNGGVIVDDAELQFGPGSKYVVAYDSSVFGIFATGSSATSISTSGGSGADGSSTTDTGALQSAGVNQQNAVIELAIIQGPLTFPDGTEQTTAFSRVKSTATGGRRIEEVAGYKQVAVTEVTRGEVLTATIRDTRTSWDFYVDATETLNLLFNDQQSFSYFEFSFDDEATWIPVTFGGGQFEVYYQMTYEDNIDRTVTQGDIVKYRVVTGGGSVEWWDKDDLPGGATDFRGAIIDYHAYTGEATIIGTIHIVDDDGEENITHTEVSSGSTDSENDDLWLVQNEGTISYRRIDGEATTLKIHWTAKVFYGSELYD